MPYYVTWGIGFALFLFVVFVYADYADRKEAKKDRSQLDFSDFELAIGGIPEVLFMQTHMYVLRGNMNKPNYHTFRILYKKAYQKELNTEVYLEMQKTFDEWKDSFTQNINFGKHSLKVEEKYTLLTSVYLLICGDNEIKEHEKSLLDSIRKVLGVSEDELQMCIDKALENVYVAA